MKKITISAAALAAFATLGMGTVAHAAVNIDTPKTLAIEVIEGDVDFSFDGTSTELSDVNLKDVTFGTSANTVLAGIFDVKANLENRTSDEQTVNITVKSSDETVLKLDPISDELKTMTAPQVSQNLKEQQFNFSFLSDKYDNSKVYSVEVSAQHVSSVPSPKA